MRMMVTTILVGVALLAPDVAQAQFGVGGGGGGGYHGRGNRGGSGPAMTPYGPVYNYTNSPEYRLYARNPAAYQQLMQQRMAQAEAKQMQAMQKQQQAFEKWLKEQKAKKDKGQPTDPAYDQLMKQVEAQQKMAQGKAGRTLAHKKTAKKAAKPATAAKPPAEEKSTAKADAPKAEPEEDQ